MSSQAINKILLVLSVSFLILLCCKDDSLAKLYKWTDNKGEVHITDYPPSRTQAGKGSVEEIEEPGIQISFDRNFIETIAAYTPAKFRKYRSKALNRISVELDRIRQTDPVYLLIAAGIFAFYHLYYALCLYLICRKTGVAPPDTAWVPVLNIFPLIDSAGKPWWWGIFFLLPLAVFIPHANSSVLFMSGLVCVLLLDIVLFARIWMRVFANFWVNRWFGLLMFLPILHLIPVGYFAFKRERHRDDIRRLQPAVVALICFVSILLASYTALYF